MRKQLFFLYLFSCVILQFSSAQTWSKLPGKLKESWKSEMAVFNNKLYIVTALYDSIDGMSVHGIASFDGTQWDTVGPGINGVPTTLGVYKDELYAGGYLLLFNQPPSGRIVKWDNSNWQGLSMVIEDRLYSMQVYKGELYVGGQFSKIGNSVSKNIARWDGTTWKSVGSGVGGGFDEVSCMAVYNDELYVGGAFGIAGSIPVNNIARWNGTKWDSVAGGFLGGGPGAMITDTVKNVLYVAGGLWQSGNKQFYGVAQWDGNTWEPLGNDTIPGGNTLCIYHGDLYSGGVGTSNYNGTVLNGIAKWNGSDWVQLGGTGTNAGFGVSAMKVFNDDLYVGGAFSSMNGDKSIRYIARWHSPVSINEFEVNSSKFKVYPNPGHGELLVELEENIQGKKMQLCVYDNLGKELLRQTIHQKKETLTISQLAKGIYHAKLIAENNVTLAVKKFVVQ